MPLQTGPGMTHRLKKNADAHIKELRKDGFRPVLKRTASSGPKKWTIFVRRG